MNVHFSYKSFKSFEIEREVHLQVEKLKRRLQLFRPELVHLHGGLDRNLARKSIRVSLNLRLPSGQLAAQEVGTNDMAAIKAAFHDLVVQLDVHKDLLRSRHKRHRNNKERNGIAFEDSLAAVHPTIATDGDIRSFINANLGKLAFFIARELRYRESIGLLDVNAVAREEVLDEAVASALGDGEERPESFGLEAWLYKVALHSINRISDGDRGVADAIRFEQPVRSQNVTASDEEYFQFHQPDDYIDEEGLIPDLAAGTPEQSLESDELIAQIETALRHAASQDRDAFILFAIEGFSLEEIARIAGRSTEQVLVSIERARETVTKRLPTSYSPKLRLLRQKLV